MNQPLSDTDRVPLRIADAEDFGRVRAFFRAVPYDEATLRAVLSIDSVGALRTVDWAAVPPGRLPPALKWCLDLFVRGRSSTLSEARTLCGELPFAALLALGLIRIVQHAPDRVDSPVAIHPVDGFLVVSDRHEDTFVEAPPPDLVFPADEPGTLMLIRLMPAIDGESLDLGGGSGIGALHMSRTARLAITSDITARAAAFATFNAHLNGAAIVSAEGDLYSPLAGRQFDLITFHPPFLPQVANARVFSAGGATGEELIRRAIAGLPEFLRPGGTCLVVCAGQDTDDARFEQRAGGWLGPLARSFDIVFALERSVPVGDAIAAFRQRAKLTEPEALDLTERLRAHRTRQFAYGALAFHRGEDKDEPVEDAPLRVSLAPDTTGADFERLFAWRRRRRDPGFGEWLAKARPRPSPELEVTVDSVVKDNTVVPQYTFSVAHHFLAALRPDPFIVPLIRRLDGSTSVARAFAKAYAAKELPLGFSMAPLMSLVAMMIERGFLIL